MAIFQRPFGAKYGDNIDSIVDVRNNIVWPQEHHVACVFLLDTSSSMIENDAIGKLNAGLRTFRERIVNDSSVDEYTKSCIEVALVSLGPDVQVRQEFTPVSKMVLPTLTANGGTPMGAGIDKALDMIKAQKVKYNELGTPYYRPWIFCITGGAPDDSYLAAAQRLKEMENAKKVLGYCVGVANFDRYTMADIFNTERIFELENLNFSALFKFVSSALEKIIIDTKADRFVAVEAPSDLHTMIDIGL